MNAYDIIFRKRNGKALTQAELQWFVDGFTSGDVTEYQAAALLMAA